MTSTTNLGSPRHYRARKAIAVRNGNTQAAGEADALLRASKADEFLRRRSLITEYQAHRVLARHGPGERCDECGLIVAELGSASETAQL